MTGRGRVATLVLVAWAACGEPAAPPPPCTTCAPRFVAVGAGNGFACALDADGRAWCWGDNRAHQIEVSDRPHVAIAQAMPGHWDALAVGGGHACGLDDGALHCWGRNDRGQVHLDAGAVVDEPRVIDPAAIEDGPARWDAVFAGFAITCAIGEGRLYCWGAGDLGQLGTGAIDDARPTLVAPAITDWVTASLGAGHACAVSASRGLYCWGDNSRGALGDGTAFVRYEPDVVRFSDDVTVTAVAVGLDSTCAIASGALYCWGRADQGALGEPALVDPDGGDRLAPVLASATRGWTQVAASERAFCGLADGTAYCWGTAHHGGLGGGRLADARAWVRVARGATALALGWSTQFEDSATNAGDLELACIVTAGDVACWGDNRYGQLGQGATTFAPTPIALGGDRTWRTLAAGAAHVCGIADDGTSCWGSAQTGAVDGRAWGGAFPCPTSAACDVGEPRPLAIAATALALGRGHTCALATDTLHCWGASALGQLGTPDPSTAIRALSGEWGDLIATGGDGACATSLDGAGELRCWGAVITTHAPLPEPALDGVRAIRLGPGFGCALDATGALACFGDPADAAFGNGEPGACGDARCNATESAATCPADCGPGPLTPLVGRVYTALAVGMASRFACALRPDARVECWGANAHGQVGAVDGAPLVPVPAIVPGLTGCTQLAAGGTHACALCNDTLACWGDQRRGALGAGSLSGRPEPARIIAPLTMADPWAEVIAGIDFTCARTRAGHAACWGSSPHGALGTGATAASRPVTIRVTPD